MQKTEVRFLDDIDGGDAAETIRFALDGTAYEIDLSAGHAQEMRDEFARWIAGARKARHQSVRGKRPRFPRTDLPDIREYAASRGYPIKDRGRVPARIVEEYDRVKSLADG